MLEVIEDGGWRVSIALLWQVDGLVVVVDGGTRSQLLSYRCNQVE